MRRNKGMNNVHGLQVTQSKSPSLTPRRISLITVFMLMVSACSYTYQDNDGAHHIVGLVAMRVAEPSDPIAIAGDVTDSTTLGLSLSNTDNGVGLVFGYNRTVIANMKNHALVMGRPYVLLKTSQPKEQKK
ncbi:MAG: hypothetical protein ACI9DC_001811 [Gammaproteobacteria bacterium]